MKALLARTKAKFLEQRGDTNFISIIIVLAIIIGLSTVFKGYLDDVNSKVNTEVSSFEAGYSYDGE